MNKRQRRLKAQGMMLIMAGILFLVPGLFYGLQAAPFLIIGAIAIVAGTFMRWYGSR